MKNNRLIVDDTEYVIDAAYIEGAKSFRESVPHIFNPHRAFTEKYDSWDYGHANDSYDLHIIDGVDVILAPRNGTVYRTTTG